MRLRCGRNLRGGRDCLQERLGEATKRQRETVKRQRETVKGQREADKGQREADKGRGVRLIKARTVFRPALSLVAVGTNTHCTPPGGGGHQYALHSAWWRWAPIRIAPRLVAVGTNPHCDITWRYMGYRIASVIPIYDRLHRHTPSREAFAAYHILSLRRNTSAGIPVRSKR